MFIKIVFLSDFCKRIFFSLNFQLCTGNIESVSVGSLLGTGSS